MSGINLIDAKEQERPGESNWRGDLVMDEVGGAGRSDRKDRGVLISVLVTPTKSGGSLAELLLSLASECAREEAEICPDAEVIMVVPTSQQNQLLENSLGKVRSFGLSVKIILVDRQQPGDVPQWRAMAFCAASGQTCVFLEDNACILNGWWEAWAEWARRDDWHIASGLVQPDQTRLSAWGTGVFFCEYGTFIPASMGQTLRPMNSVAGNHWAVRRKSIDFIEEFKGQRTRNENEQREKHLSIDSATDETDSFTLATIDEFDWVQRLAKQGQKPKWNELALVQCYRAIGWREAIFERAIQGFGFGSEQGRKAGWQRRIKMIICGPAIFWIQFGRLFRVVIERRSQIGIFIKSIPLTMILLLSWSLAEWAGWTFGTLGSFFHLNFKNRAKEHRQNAKENVLVDGKVIKVDEAGILATELANLSGSDIAAEPGIVA